MVSFFFFPFPFPLPGLLLWLLHLKPDNNQPEYAEKIELISRRRWMKVESEAFINTESFLLFQPFSFRIVALALANPSSTPPSFLFLCHSLTIFQKFKYITTNKLRIRKLKESVVLKRNNEK